MDQITYRKLRKYKYQLRKAYEYKKSIPLTERVWLGRSPDRRLRLRILIEKMYESQGF